MRRWPVKTIAMSAIYGVLGLVIFGYTALLAYSNFFRMEVQTAVISAPSRPSRRRPTAASTGGVKPGDRVKAGT